MSAHPVSWYRDPAVAYEREQERTCVGCAWVHHLTGVPRCGAGKRYGKRCVNYQERDHRNNQPHP